MPRGRPAKPSPEKEYFEVEKLLNKRFVKGAVEYLVKWKGFDEAESTWETAGNLASILDLVLEFENQLLE